MQRRVGAAILDLLHEVRDKSLATMAMHASAGALQDLVQERGGALPAPLLKAVLLDSVVRGNSAKVEVLLRAGGPRLDPAFSQNLVLETALGRVSDLGCTGDAAQRTLEVLLADPRVGTPPPGAFRLRLPLPAAVALARRPDIEFPAAVLLTYNRSLALDPAIVPGRISRVAAYRALLHASHFNGDVLEHVAALAPGEADAGADAEHQDDLHVAIQWGEELHALVRDNSVAAVEWVTFDGGSRFTAENLKDAFLTGIAQGIKCDLSILVHILRCENFIADDDTEFAVITQDRRDFLAEYILAAHASGGQVGEALVQFAMRMPTLDIVRALHGMGRLQVQDLVGTDTLLPHSHEVHECVMAAMELLGADLKPGDLLAALHSLAQRPETAVLMSAMLDAAADRCPLSDLDLVDTVLAVSTLQNADVVLDRVSPGTKAAWQSGDLRVLGSVPGDIVVHMTTVRGDTRPPSPRTVLTQVFQVLGRPYTLPALLADRNDVGALAALLSALEAVLGASIVSDLLYSNGNLVMRRAFGAPESPDVVRGTDHSPRACARLLLARPDAQLHGLPDGLRASTSLFQDLCSNQRRHPAIEALAAELAEDPRFGPPTPGDYLAAVEADFTSAVATLVSKFGGLGPRAGIRPRVYSGAMFDLAMGAGITPNCSDVNVLVKDTSLLRRVSTAPGDAYAAMFQGEPGRALVFGTGTDDDAHQSFVYLLNHTAHVDILGLLPYLLQPLTAHLMRIPALNVAALLLSPRLPVEDLAVAVGELQAALRADAREVEREAAPDFVQSAVFADDDDDYEDFGVDRVRVVRAANDIDQSADVVTILRQVLYAVVKTMRWRSSTGTRSAWAGTVLRVANARK